MQFKIILLTVGGLLIFFGVQEWIVSQGTSSEPESVNLAEIEGGSIPKSNYVSVGNHMAVYAGAVYSYSQGKYDTGPPGPTTKVDYCYYPVLSSDHKFIKEAVAYEVALAAAPADKPPDAPKIGDFAMLVKTKKFKTIGAIPDEISVTDNVQGLIVNRITSLKADEKNLLKQSFTSLNFDKVLILEDGRQPAGVLKLLGLLGGGSLLLLGAIGWFLAGYMRSS